jgi:hypothetical protein
MVIFINGLPVMTFELKNSLTKQTVADAMTQYQTDRNRNELLFQLGLRGAHRGGRCQGAVLPASHLQNLVVSAVQPGVEQRRGNPPSTLSQGI